MFTQCPECQTTFRVTAAVLQQAEGRVRCGGCGSAFNALQHLCEDGSAAGARNTQTSTGSPSDKNRQLLETLEKLAGPNVTIEDTGVEWRVLGDMDEDDDASEPPAMLGRKDDIPRRVPEAQERLDLQDAEPSVTDPNELRFDDNTILPEDFGMEDDLDELPFLEKAEPPKRRAGDREAIQHSAEFAEAQVDLALGEPDDWADLLDEVNVEEDAAEEPEDEIAMDATARDNAAAANDEPPEEDMPSDIDTQFLLQAEEMGLDTGSHEIIAAEDAEAADEDLSAADIDDLGDEDQEEGHDEALALEEDDEEAEEDAVAEVESTADYEAQIAEDEDEAGDAASKESVELELESEEDDIASAIRGGKDVSKLFDESSPLVETIVMEGEMISDTMNPERKKVPRATTPFTTPVALEDTYSLSRGRIRGGRRASDPPSYTVIASVVILGLLLAGQLMHQSRQSLATYGAFNHTIGSVYRVLGKPVTPDWDIRGWQFETTNGSVDEEEDLLTIYSRIANKSDQALPYPLVHISLTDRWEDIIGSRVLEPSQYLAGDLDPRKPVPPDENFTAVITIESPAAEATGFRLTPCYRIVPGRVRCATQDFKN